MTNNLPELPKDYGTIVFDARQSQPAPTSSQQTEVVEKPIPSTDIEKPQENWTAKADAITTSLSPTIGLSGFERERLRNLAEDHNVSEDRMVELIVRESLNERIGKPIIKGPSFATKKVTGPSRYFTGGQQSAY